MSASFRREITQPQTHTRYAKFLLMKDGSKLEFGGLKDLEGASNQFIIGANQSSELEAYLSLRRINPSFHRLEMQITVEDQSEEADCQCGISESEVCILALIVPYNKKPQ